MAELQADGILLVQDGNHGEYRPRPNEFNDEGVAFIRAADMDAGRVLFESASKINEVARRRITKGIGAPGDVLLSHKGTVGKLALVPDDAPEFVCSPQTTFWRSLAPRFLDQRYLYAYLRSPGFHAQLRSRAGETDMAPYVSLTAQRGLIVVLPPLPEQRAIASILGALDDKIELNRRMNETLEELARTIFKSWFVDFDPVKAKAEGRQPEGMDAETAKLFPSRFVESELGMIPEGWSVGPIERVCERVENGGTPRRNNPAFWSPPEVPWLTSGEVRQSFVVATEASISRTGYENSSAKLWPSGTTIVAMYGATAGEVTMAATEMSANQACCGLVPRRSCRCLIYASMQHGRAALARSARGSAQQNLSQGLVRSYRIVIPSEKVFAAVENAMGPLLDRAVASIRESSTLAELRDLLLPKLISGELRVPDAEKLAEAAL